MFLTGPAVVRDVMGEDVSADDLGGYKVHEKNGVAHFVATDDGDAALLVRERVVERRRHRRLARRFGLRLGHGSAPDGPPGGPRPNAPT
jgi:hypothetical protein